MTSNAAGVDERRVERSPQMLSATSSLDQQIHWFTVAAGVAFALGFAIGLWSLGQFTHKELAALGSFLAGTVTPIWSVAGLLLIYVAFLGQRRQILLQEESIELNRIELLATREELRGQKEQLALQKQEMESQNRLVGQQAFDNSFYELLRFTRNAATDLLAKPGGGTVKQGQVAFQGAVDELTGRLNIAITPEPGREGWLGIISQQFRDICLNSQSDFGHYFRTTYHLLRVIDASSEGDRYRYSSLVRAQLSNAELVLLFVDGLSDVGRDKLKPLLEKYSFLKPIRLPTSLEKFREYYEPKAFIPL